MKFKDIFKTLEGIIVLSAFGMVIATGFKMFAYVGAIGYLITNIKGGVDKVVKAYKSVVKFFKKNEI